jgi:hypothetical protein
MKVTIFNIITKKLFSLPAGTGTYCMDCGGHLGGRARLPDTVLEDDHPMTIPSKLGSN